MLATRSTTTLVLGCVILMASCACFVGFVVTQQALLKHYHRSVVVSWYSALTVPLAGLHCLIDGSALDGRLFRAISSPLEVCAHHRLLFHFTHMHAPLHGHPGAYACARLTSHNALSSIRVTWHNRRWSSYTLLCLALRATWSLWLQHRHTFHPRCSPPALPLNRSSCPLVSAKLVDLRPFASCHLHAGTRTVGARTTDPSNHAPARWCCLLWMGCWQSATAGLCSHNSRPHWACACANVES